MANKTEANQRRALLPDIGSYQKQIKERIGVLVEEVKVFEAKWGADAEPIVPVKDRPGSALDPSEIISIYDGFDSIIEKLDHLITRLNHVKVSYIGE